MGIQVEPEVVRERSVLLLKQSIRSRQIAESYPLEPVETVPRLLVLGGDRNAQWAAQEALQLSNDFRKPFPLLHG